MLFFKVLPILLLQFSFTIQENFLKLNDANFHSQIAEHKVALVMFSEPSCKICKDQKPKFVVAAKNLLKNELSIALAEVDCSESKNTCAKYKVKNQFPSFKIFRHGEFSQTYTGPKDSAGIVKYMKTQLGPTSLELMTTSCLKKFLDAAGRKCALVGFFQEHSAMKEAFFKMSLRLRDLVRYAHSSSEDVLDSQGLKDDIIFVRPLYLHNTFEDNSLRYNGEPDVLEIEKFILKNYHGLVGIRTPGNMDDFNTPLVIVYCLVNYIRDPKGTRYRRNKALMVAKEFKGNATFVLSSADQFQDELEHLGLNFRERDKPVAFARDGKTRKFLLNDEYSAERLRMFVKGVLDGSWEPYIVKSEKVPENDDNYVKTAVAKNFYDLVIDNQKDTLVGFYSLWCDRCYKLATAYEAFARQLKDEDIVFVRMNAFDNDVPDEYKVTDASVPTAYWAPKNRKFSPLLYEGKLERRDLLKFIAKQSTEELKGYDREGNVKFQKTEL